MFICSKNVSSCDTTINVPWYSFMAVVKISTFWISKLFVGSSKIIVGYSTKYWEIWKGYNGALRPDIEIKYSLKNFKNNIDEAIEYVTNRK